MTLDFAHRPARMPTTRLFPRTVAALLLAVAATAVAAEPPFPLSARRILFLGDSITHSGGYIARIETQLRLQGVSPLPEFINLGLSSETCSGLSEPTHPFPRPTVHERLDRALAALEPDVVVACYGMNDGVYAPLSEERFAAYQQGVNRLIEKVHAAGAKLILLTPPPFDPVPLRSKGKLQPAGQEPYGFTGMYEDYDAVLTRYAEWLLAQQDRVALVVDVHTAVAARLAERRQSEPQFTFAGDGVHPNPEGHRVIAETVLKGWGIADPVEPPPELLKLVSQRLAVLHDAWLTQVGHQRPGVKPGLPLDEARAKAAELDAQIAQLAASISP